ncbi:MAG: methylated-DNA--[protein]-cysteine S-methyltransferase [Prevotellaceae bacterium]|nr:methylated-DNA--[protein]-cysteine S-methyltransferase [Prevotellaceae bacterium]
MEKIIYGVADTLFGACTVAFSQDKVFSAGFYCDEKRTVEEIFRRVGKVVAERDDLKATEITQELLSNTGRVSLHPNGSEFQQKVWKALCEIPFGTTTAYSEIAAKIGKPKSIRAVANAIGTNPIALFIPCHRVIRIDGSLGGYRWGVDLKEKILEWEQSTLKNGNNRQL